ncbi:MAG: O-antigen ligase family protein [Pseudomonadota bacterium]
MAVCFAAASVGLPVAIVGIAKVILFLTAAVCLLFAVTIKDPGDETTPRRTGIAVLVALAALTLSLLWTTAPLGEATGSLGKYGKLLTIPVIAALLRSRAEAIYALAAFAITQLVLVVSAFLLFVKLPVPWAISHTALTFHAVYSSYLAEGLMAAVFAAVCWHMRAMVPGRYGAHAAIAAASLALFNVFFVFEGRSGHVVAVILISLSIMWALPSRYRLSIILLPFILLSALYFASPQVQNRINLVKNEVQAFKLEAGSQEGVVSSTGTRLHLWTRALQAIKERPLAGFGVGSWSTEYNRVDRLHDSKHQDIQPLGNPHQEYLQWGVQLGLVGIAILLAILTSIFADSRRMHPMAARTVQSALVALAVSCLFNSTLYDALVGDFFCVVLGIALGFGRYPPASHPAIPGDRHGARSS